jgi:vacuolar-type H+-ATPase subunit C/Vma6
MCEYITLITVEIIRKIMKNWDTFNIKYLLNGTKLQTESLSLAVLSHNPWIMGKHYFYLDVLSLQAGTKYMIKISTVMRVIYSHILYFLRYTNYCEE